MNRRLPLCVTLLTAALAGGCGKKKEPSPPVPPAAPAPAPASPPAARAGLEAVPTSTVADDPGRDGWDTEAANELIGAQVTALKSWLTAGERSADDDAKFIAADCAGTAAPEMKNEAPYEDGV